MPDSSGIELFYERRIVARFRVRECVPVPSKNERVELEMKILDYRRLRRQISTDPITVKRIDELIAELQQQLREIDE